MLGSRPKSSARPRCRDAERAALFRVAFIFSTFPPKPGKSPQKAKGEMLPCPHHGRRVHRVGSVKQPTKGGNSLTFIFENSRKKRCKPGGFSIMFPFKFCGETDCSTTCFLCHDHDSVINATARKEQEERMNQLC